MVNIYGSIVHVFFITLFLIFLMIYYAIRRNEKRMILLDKFAALPMLVTGLSCALMFIGLFFCFLKVVQESLGMS